MSKDHAIRTDDKLSWPIKLLSVITLILFFIYLKEIFTPFSINLMGEQGEVAKTGYCGWAYIFNAFSLTLLTLFLVFWVPYECLRNELTYKDALKISYSFSVILFLGWLLSHFYWIDTIQHKLVYWSDIYGFDAREFYVNPQIYVFQQYGNIQFRLENLLFPVLLVTMCVLWRKVIKPWKALLIFIPTYLAYFLFRSLTLLYMIFGVEECKCFQVFTRYLIHFYISPALRTSMSCSV